MGITHAANVDIGANITSFDAVNDVLTNTGGLTTWSAGWSAGTDFSGQDFTTLGVTTIEVTAPTTNGTASDNFSGANFNGLILATSNSAGNNYFYNDNFSGATFVGSTINLNGNGAYGNQPFIGANLTGTDFSGATFNYDPYGSTTSTQVVNIFRDATMSGADFTGAIFNFTIEGSGVNVVSGFWGDGAVDLTDATFNFTGDSGHVATVTAALVDNFDASNTYNQAFFDNNYAAFGFTDATSFMTAVIPEPSSTALLSMGALAFCMRRKRG